MNIVVCGNGKSGSWKIRGEQLGQAIGATVDHSPKSIAGYDKMIVVKRPGEYLTRARKARLPVVYDIVDAWQSVLPGNSTRAQCIRWLAQQIDVMQPSAVVAATKVMADDLKQVTDVPVLALPHHARPDQPINTIRPEIRAVGYEGSEKYLGWWDGFMDAECAKRGWKWVKNPATLAELDVVVAMRDVVGYAPMHWKSNVKLANAQATGTPCVVNGEQGYRETMAGPELRAESADEMVDALDRLVEWGQDGRRAMAKTMRAGAPMLEDVAGDYKRWLGAL